MASEPKGYIRVPVWVDGGVVKPLVNDDGRIPVLLDLSSITLDVNLKSSDITLGVTESSPLTSIQSQLYGWDLTYWRKNPLVWGYTAVYSEPESSVNVTEGHHNLTFSTVPAGYIRVITNYIAHCSTANPSNITMRCVRNSTVYNVNIQSPVVASKPLAMPGYLVLAVDDYLVVRFEGCSLNDDIFAYALGYDMKVNE